MCRKRFLMSLFVLALIICQGMAITTPYPISAQTDTEIADLVIHQNIPEVELTVLANNRLALYGIHLYKDGHFKKAGDNITWESSNKNVADVDQHGMVQFTGQPGRTFVTVSDQMYTDRIALDYKVDNKSKDKNKPDRTINVVKEKGERYQIIEKAIAGMTLEEKVGQMMMPDFRKFNDKDVTEMLPEIEELVKRYYVGGVILFRENVVNTEQTIKLVDAYQKAAEKYGLLITIDQEGGIVTRLQSGTDMPGNMALGATRSNELAWKVGDAIGRELVALGINTNFAPVVDVNNNPDNPVIGVRSIGEDPQLVADLGTAYVKGLQNNGIAATTKHFPGHGDTAVDSHLGLPEVPHDKDRLMKVELYPFKQAIDQGVDAIMTAHVTFPKIDDTKVISKKDGTEIAVPATLSKKVLTDLVRDELGFNGVVSTDAMNMQAIADHFGPVDAAVRAIKAGVDIVLMPIGLEEVTAGVLQAVANKELTENMLETSVKRILTLKVKRGIFKAEEPINIDEQIESAKKVIGSKENKEVEAEAAARSITLVKNDNLLPLNLENTKKIAVVGTTYIENLAEAIKAHHFATTTIKIANNILTQEQWKQLAEADVIIIGSYTFNVSGRSPDNPLMKLYNQIINQSKKPVIAVSIRNPYDIMAYPEVDAYLAQYGFKNASFAALADTIFGSNSPTGKLPVTIPDGKGGTLYEYGHGLEYSK